MKTRLGGIGLWALALACLLGPCPSLAQAPPLEWRYLHRAEGSDDQPLLREAPDGGWVAVFRNSGQRAMVVKLDAKGRFLWELLATAQGTPTEAEVLPDGSVFLLTHDGSRVDATHVSSTGQKIRSFPWPAPSEKAGTASFPTIHRHSGEGFLAAGSHRVRDTDVFLSRFGSDGTLLWSRSLEATGDEALSSITPTPDGGYWVVMRSESPISGDKTVDEPGTADFWAVLLDAKGGIVRQETRAHDPRLIGKVGDGNLFVEVTDDRWKGVGFGQTDLWIYQTDASGAIERDKLLGGGWNERFHQAVSAADGGWYLVCETELAQGGTMPARQGATDAWIVKLDASGNLQWQRTYGGRESDYSPRLIPIPDGGFVLSAHSASDVGGTRTSLAAPGRFGRDLWLMRADREGRPLWDFAIPMAVGYEIRQTRDGGWLLAVVVTGDGERRNSPIMPSDEVLFLKFAPDGLRQEDLLPALRRAPSRTLAGAWNFATRVGYSYVVEASPTMRPNSWTPVLGIQGDGDERTFPALAERGAARQFFRLRTALPEPR